MDNKFEISWHDQQRLILQINFLTNLSWAELLNAVLEVLEIARATPNEVTLLINAFTHKIESVEIGRIMDSLFHNLPRTPKVLKRIIILPEQSQRFMLKAGIETIAEQYFGKGFLNVVSSLEEAEKFINTAR